MIEFLNRLMEKFINLIDSLNINYIFDYVLIVLIFYLIISFISFHISIYFIFKKEGLNPFKTFIPFYNLYLIFKYFHISLYTLFVPIVNIFGIIGIPYNICRAFRTSPETASLSIIFPYVILPILAFNKEHTKYYQEKKLIIKKQDDVYDLESKMDNTDVIIEKEVIINPEEFNDDFKLNQVDLLDQKLENSEYKKINEEDLFAEQYTEEEKEELETLDVKEENDTNIIMDNIDAIANMGSINSAKITELNANETVKEKEKDEVTLAFGGKTKTEESTNAKKDDLKCSRCGSSLVGNNGYCPGCGIKL